VRRPILAQEPGVDLDVKSEPDWQHGLRLYQAYDRDAGARDVKTLPRLRPSCPTAPARSLSLAIASEGLMTFLTAVRYEVDAAVVYHGGDTEKYLQEADSSMRRC